MIRIIIEVDDKRQVFINGKKINQPGQKPLKSKIESGSDSRRQSMDSERICPTCQEPFKPNGPRQKYCSEKCGMKPKPESEKIRAKQRRENKSGSVRITPNLRPKPKQLPKKAIGQKAICSKCGKEFIKTWYSQKLCIECRLKPKTNKKICVTCGKEFKPSGNSQKFCFECRMQKFEKLSDKEESNEFQSNAKKSIEIIQSDNNDPDKEFAIKEEFHITPEQIKRSQDHPYDNHKFSN